MVILLRTSGFLVSATNVLNLLNKKIPLFSFVYFQSSHCMLIHFAYRRLLKESPEEIRKPKYTNRATIFSLQKYFKCYEGNNHWTSAKCRSSLTLIVLSSNSRCLCFFSPWPWSSAPPSSSLSSTKPSIQKYCKKSIELNICK